MKTYYYMTIGLVIIFFLFMVTKFGGLNLYAFLETFEWVTKFILPWIALYWFVRYVKSKTA